MLAKAIIIPEGAAKTFTYDDWLEFFREIPAAQLSAEQDRLKNEISTEGYAALCRWLEIIENPSKMDKLYQGRIKAQKSMDIMEIAVGDDDEAFWEALIRENVAQLNSSTSSPQEVARLTQNLGIFRDKLHEIRARKPKKGSTLEKVLAKMEAPENGPSGSRLSLLRKQRRVEMQGERKMAKMPLKGCQKPRIDIHQSGDTEKADLLLELLDEYGTNLLDWQRLVLRRWLAEDKDGKFVNMTCGLSVPRQNGKTEIIVARIIYGIIFRKSVGLFTAQKQNTADVVRNRVQEFFYESPFEEIFNLLTPRFQQKPKNIDFIEFQNGARIQFITRTRMGGLGMTIDDLICDEAADMMDSHQESLLSTTSAAKTGNPQVVYCGTPPMAESVGEVFSRVRKEALSGASRYCWTEWSVESLTDKDDEGAWKKTNPSLGHFLLPRAVENEAQSLSVDGFNRMRLGWWSGIEEKRAIPQKMWEACITEKPAFDNSFRPVYAVKFAPDRSEYSLVVAQPLMDCKIHVEIIMQRPMDEGFSRLTKWLIDRWRDCARIVIDGTTGQAILFEDLTSGGVPPKRIIQPNMKEIVAAHQFVYDAITRGELSHYNQPKLNQTVRITKQRPMGRYGGFGWESMSKNLSTAALDAATFAYWGQKVFGKKKTTVADREENRGRWRDILSNI